MVEMKESEILHDKELEFIKVIKNSQDVVMIVTNEGIISVYNGTILIQKDEKRKCVKFTDVLEQK